MSPLNNDEILFELLTRLEDKVDTGFKETAHTLASIEGRVLRLELAPPLPPVALPMKTSTKIWTAVGTIAAAVTAWFLK